MKEQLATQTAATAAAEAWKSVLDRVSFSSQALQQRLDTIDGAVVEWSKHLLASGVAARDVAAYYGLTDDQIKAIQESMAKGKREASEWGGAISSAADEAAASVGR
jgi:hypothetical protein